MPRKARRQFTTAQKVAVLLRHFVDKVAISDSARSMSFNRAFSTTGRTRSSRTSAGRCSPP